MWPAAVACMPVLEAGARVRDICVLCTMLWQRQYAPSACATCGSPLWCCSLCGCLAHAVARVWRATARPCAPSLPLPAPGAGAQEPSREDKVLVKFGLWKDKGKRR